MNNNMPNNFNNNNNINSGNGNQISNPQIDRINEQLMGGQSTVGNGPSIMQGMSNVNQTGNVMQGMNNPQNNSNIIKQDKPQQAMPEMPGQNHSGINAYTMQYEQTPKQEQNQSNVGISQTNNYNAMNNMTNNNYNPNNLNNSQMPVNDINRINNPQTINQNLNNNVMNNSLNNQFGYQNNISNNSNTINNMRNESVTNNPDEFINNNSNQNMAYMNNNMAGEQPLPKNDPQNNIGPNPTLNNYNSVGGIKPTSTGTSQVGISQVGQTEMNHQAMATDIKLDEPKKKKKFPLSTRETVLVAIALIGIVVVIIMYT